MKRNELFELRELVDDEIKRRKRISELLTNELVMEYLEITKTDPVDLDIDSISEIISKILSSFTITKTNGIYVCTSAWYLGCHTYYQGDEYYSVDVKIDSEYAEYKVYTDIESNKSITAITDEYVEEIRYGRPLISTFEKDNIILNPYNTSENKNGYEEVKFDFFRTALKDGQAKAKKLILSKYPKL